MEFDEKTKLISKLLTGDEETGYERAGSGERRICTDRFHRSGYRRRGCRRNYILRIAALTNNGTNRNIR